MVGREQPDAAACGKLSWFWHHARERIAGWNSESNILHNVFRDSSIGPFLAYCKYRFFLDKIFEKVFGQMVLRK